MLFDIMNELFDDLNYWENLSGGYSSEIKYVVHTSNDVYIVRFSDRELYPRRKKEYDMMKHFHEAYSFSTQSLSCGIIENYAYIITTWIDAHHLENLSDSELYDLGLQAGHIHKAYHQIPIEAKRVNMADKYRKKLAYYLESKDRLDNDEPIIAYIQEHMHLIEDRPLAYSQGDFHINNMLINKDNILCIIDFNRCDLNDPYEDFYKMQLFDPTPFKNGHLHAYFDGDVPESFWRIQALYVAVATLSSINWARDTQSESEVQIMKDIAQKSCDDYDYYSNLIPVWYQKKL